MTTIESQIDEKNKILKGLEKVYERLLEYKKAKNSDLIILQNDEIIRVKPDGSKQLIK